MTVDAAPKAKSAKDTETQIAVRKLRGKLLYKKNQIHKLEKSAYDSHPELKAKMDAMEKEKRNQYIAVEPKLEELYKIKDELRNQHAKNADVVWKMLDLDKIAEDEDGKLNGLTEQLDALKESDSYLFDSNPGGQRGGFSAGPDIGDKTTANDVVNSAIRALSGHK